MITTSIHDPKIAPPPKWEYYSDAELAQHEADGFTLAVIDTSYDQFPKAHCVALRDYNDAVDQEAIDND